MGYCVARTNEDLSTLLPQLLAFLQVVRSGTLSAAARQIGQSPSALSRQTTSLERALGVALFHRTTRSLTLTEVGHEVYRQASDIERAGHDLVAWVSALRAQPQGLLRVTAPVTLGRVILTPQIGRFIKDYPNISVDLFLSDRPVDLGAEAFDLAIRVTPSPPVDYVARELGHLQYILVGAKHNLVRVPTHPPELADETLLFPSDGDFRSDLTLRNGEQIITQQITPRLMINNTDAMVDAVEQGVGIGLLPTFVANKLIREGRLVRVLLEWNVHSNVDTRIYILSPQRKWLPRKSRTFLDFMLGGIDEWSW
ncbi:LysR family transcriptional regulator [Nguyenibacter sp. L1]|uniref:LysR family transcriptional regulator n=1 Tax=Nguyenibacter sp. L1 TaxID=3049350 RepID=UPI002B49B0A4|nr:LysR family transcriptional regulator [Nguyenibacter sp. L1]WRH86676.1 LysR family transcriptional regulator [Nguyenibacter sp. L1]